MATKPSPKKNSEIIQVYIDKYAALKRHKYETIYTMKPDDLAEICDFADAEHSRVFLCFYNFSAEKYDKMTLQDIYTFAEGSNQYPFNRYSVTKNGLKFGINICVPVRDGVVDRALVNEMLSHELNHTYRIYREYMDGHILHPRYSKRTRLERQQIKENPRIKYTFSQKMDRYNYIRSGIKNDSSIRDNFYWIGYALSVDEINATLAGVDAFLFEHDGEYKKLSQCRSVIIMKETKKYLEEVKTSATDKDWEYCRKNALYIYERKNESIERFKTRYITYYTKQLNFFDNRLEKLVDKYKLKTAQKRLLNETKTGGLIYSVKPTYEK